MSSYSEEKADNQMYSLERIEQQLDESKFDFSNEFNYAKWRTESDLYDLIVLCDKKDSKWYSKIKKNLRHGFSMARKCSVCKRDRLRAFLFLIHPDIIPSIMKIRKKVYIK